MALEQNIILQVLDMYKNMPNLWDRFHRDYNNKFTRETASRELLEVYQEYDANATIKSMNKKIQNLRTNYFQQVQRLKKARKSGEPIRRLYQPSLWYFKALTFLGDKGDCRSKWNPMKLLTSSSSDDEESYENEYCGAPPTKMRRTASQDTSQDNEPVGEDSQDSNKEWEIIGRSIGLQLQDLDTKQLTITQKLIADAIYYAKFGLLTENSHISLGAVPHPPR